MSKKRIRVPMFFKFLAGCLFLALMLIAGFSWRLYHETKMRSRGNYLAKHFKRYVEYQKGLGEALSAVTELLAHDVLLRRSLAEPRQAGAAGPTGPEAQQSAADIAAQAFQLLSGKNSIKPDLMLVFDSAGELVWSRLTRDPGTVDPQDLDDMKAVAKVRSGDSIHNKVLIYDGRPYVAAGAPVRSPAGKELIGGLVLGVALEHYMDEYKRQSDDKELLQHRLTFFRDGKVAASTVDAAQWDELPGALLAGVDGKRDWKLANERGSFRQPFISLSSGDYDVYGGQGMEGGVVEGYAGLHDGALGELFLIRSRNSQENRKPVIPWGVLIVGAVLSLVVASVLAFLITRPIQRFVVQTRGMLEGETDLTQRIELSSRDEIQDLADNINQVFERLYLLATEVQGAAFQVGASSAEISAASKQMLGGLKDQTLKIESSTAAVTELSTSIQQVAANAAETTQVAEKSNVAVTSAVARMDQIRSAVEDAAEKMRELGESSKRIGNIVEVIRQISEQTSLLALNASIEAAHAGEQGRGFAVVADEVSSLARRVGQSAKDIEALIQTIKEQTTEAVSSMQTGTSEVEEGTQLVTDTLTDLGNLIHVVKETAQAVQEQAVVSDEIARNMDAVQHIAAEVLSGSEESVVQSEQLHELAFALEQSVNSFNLDGHAPAQVGREPEPPRSGRAVQHVLAAPRASRSLPARGSRSSR